MDKPAIIAYIKPVELFIGLTEKDLDDIATIMETETFQEGELIITEGDEGNKDFYILVEGSVVAMIETKKEEDGANIHVMKEGQIFGELSLVSDTPRSATIKATSEVKVLRMPKMFFDKLAEVNNHLGMVIYRNMAKTLAHRIKNTNKMLRHTIMWGW